MYLRTYDAVDMTSEQQKKGGGIHPCHEILIISSGDVLLEWMGNNYVAKAPALFLLAPNTPHLLVRQSAACSFLYMELDMQGSAEFPNLAQMLVWNGLQSSDERHAPELAQVYSAARSLCTVLSPHFTYEAVKEQIALLEVRKLLLLIVCCLQSRSLPLSRLPDSARFREQTGGVRLNAAACFLSTTNMPVQDVAVAVGIPNIHYFSRLFKQTCGVCPTQWRARGLVQERI